jgi:hypothetical protein
MPKMSQRAAGDGLSPFLFILNALGLRRLIRRPIYE